MLGAPVVVLGEARATFFIYVMHLVAHAPGRSGERPDHRRLPFSSVMQ